MEGLAERIDALLAMPKKQLRVEWRRYYLTDPPEVSSNMLRLGISYRMQEKAFGGLSRKIQTRLRRIAKGGAVGDANAGTIKPGTRLVRKWNGQTIVVLATGDGFLFAEKTYSSLSVIAREITGTHWSGPRFFGLVKAKAPNYANA